MQETKAEADLSRVWLLSRRNAQVLPRAHRFVICPKRSNRPSTFALQPRGIAGPHVSIETNLA